MSGQGSPFALPFAPAPAGSEYESVLPLELQIDPVTGQRRAGTWPQLAVPGLIRNAVNDLAMTVQGPGAVAQGKVDQSQIPQLASTMTGTLMGAGMGADTLVGEASPEVLGSFRGYHGTPYTFEPVEGNPLGKFKNQAIGSGEGAQVYGWGHYVAGAKQTAEEYRKNLTDQTNPGSLYHVEIRPDESELLDWDKPLGQQSPAVQDKLKPLLQQVQSASNVDSSLKSSVTQSGEHLYNTLSHMSGEWDTAGAAASEALHSAGIPGIKYADAFSRNGKTPNPTSNYVIFHPDDLKIVGRNGVEAPQQLSPVDHDPFAPGGGAP